MEPGDEMIIPGVLEGSCNIVSYIWSVEGETYGSICDKINSPMGCGDEIIVPGDLEGSCNKVSSSVSFERKIYLSILNS